MDRTFIYIFGGLKNIVALALPLLFGGNATAQTELSLEEALQQARQNNTRSRIMEQEVALGKAEVAGTSSAYLPRVSASYMGMYTNDPLNAFGFKLKQRRIGMSDFDPALLNDPDGTWDFNTKFSVEQPLLNFDAFAARKAMKNKLKAVQYQKDFSDRYIAVEVQSSFERLRFLYEAKKAVDMGVETYEEALRTTENMREQGLVKRSDVLLVQVGLSNVRHERIDIENNIAQVSDHLNWLMGREGHTVYFPTGALTLAEGAATDAPLADDRADLKAMRAGLEAQRGMVSVNRNALLPRVNAFGDYNLNDKDAFGFDTNSYLVGLVVSWDLFKGNGIRNQVAQEKVNTKKAELEMQLHVEQQKLQLEKTKRDLAAAQVLLALAETARDQAEEATRIINDRYDEGLERTTDLLAAQASKMEKQVGYLQAVLEHNLALIQFDFMTNPDHSIR